MTFMLWPSADALTPSLSQGEREKYLGSIGSQV